MCDPWRVPWWPVSSQQVRSKAEAPSISPPPSLLGYLLPAYSPLPPCSATCSQHIPPPSLLGYVDPP